VIAPEARAPNVRAHRVLWAIPLALALHNAEEALTFPAFLPLVRERVPDVARGLAARIDVHALYTALVVVTLLVVLVVCWATWRPASPVAPWCALAVQAVVALNVVSHVIVAATVVRGDSPGLVTALAVNAPLSIHLFRRARREGWIASWSWWLLLPAALLLHGPVLIGLLLLA